MLQIGQARVAPQVSQHGVHTRCWSGNGAVDAFRSQQNQALDFIGLANRQQGGFQVSEVRQFHKFVKRGGQKIGHG